MEKEFLNPKLEKLGMMVALKAIEEYENDENKDLKKVIDKMLYHFDIKKEDEDDIKDYIIYYFQANGYDIENTMKKSTNKM